MEGDGAVFLIEECKAFHLDGLCLLTLDVVHTATIQRAHDAILLAAVPHSLVVGIIYLAFGVSHLVTVRPSTTLQEQVRVACQWAIHIQ